MEGVELTEMATSPPQLHVVTSEADDLITGAKELIDMLEIAKVESGELIGGLVGTSFSTSHSVYNIP